MQLQYSRAPVATFTVSGKSGDERSGGGRAAQDAVQVKRSSTVYSGSFLDSPKGALEFYDCSDKLWAVYERSILSCFPIGSAIEVEEGDVGSTDDGGMFQQER